MSKSRKDKSNEEAFAHALFKSMGFSEDELIDRPMIGIANSWTTLVPGHYNLNQLSDYAKRGIYRGGGTAVEFGVIAACDGIANGHEGMKYVLPSREVIANSVEIQAKAHKLDGLLLLGSCDKIVPGMLMAAARLNIPAMILNGGPMSGGIEFDGRKSDATTVDEAHGMLEAGRISQDIFEKLEDMVCPSCGSCAFLGTANTMGCLSEAMGMSLPDAGLTPAHYADRLRIAYSSGLKICELIEKNIRPRDIITKASLRNAVKTTLAIGGSTNVVIHLAAIAYEAELDIQIVDEFERLRKETPQIVKVNPSAKWDMEDFHKAGGVARVLRNMGCLIDEDCMTCTGQTVGFNISKKVYPWPENTEVIRPLEEPFAKEGGVAILRGNLAPGTGVTKPGAFPVEMHVFKGVAKVFECEEDANEAILSGKVEAGNVVVIRYEGPKGGPGMREMYKAMKYIYGRGLIRSTAVVTDGRFSGTNNGCFVGHVSPEAAEGGVIAIVKDGDPIEINIPAGRLELGISEEEIQRRFADWKPKTKQIPKGWLQIYAQLAVSAAEGGVMKPGHS
ncbi:MAG: dihydroxy-acid dehydratase [Lachnospiraceae bacterium]|nr:dihydroxy-acid dehydratase [Lachnospiraceae bacterium]